MHKHTGYDIMEGQVCAGPFRLRLHPSLISRQNLQVYVLELYNLVLEKLFWPGMDECSCTNVLSSQPLMGY